MYRQRAQSHRINSRHHDKRHCPQDLSCKECCKCVEILKKQNKILSQKNQSWLRQKDDLVKAIMKLNREIKNWQKREKQFLDMEMFKRKLRDQVRAQVQQKNKLDNLIIKQKYQNIKKQREQLERKRDQLTNQLQIITKQLRNCGQKLEQSNHLLLKQQQEYKKNKFAYQQQKDTISELKNKLINLQQLIKDKSNIIRRLQQTLNISQKNYLLEKSKSSQNQFQAIKFQQEVKKTSQVIEQLKNESNKQIKQIQVLTKDKNKLGNFVKQLQSTITSYNALQGELRNRIYVTQDYALQKQIQIIITVCIKEAFEDSDFINSQINRKIYDKLDKLQKKLYAFV